MFLNRREFLKTSALSVTALGVSQFGVPSIARAKGANSKLRVAVAGIAGRGAGNISELMGGSGELVELAAKKGKTVIESNDNNTRILP